MEIKDIVNQHDIVDVVSKYVHLNKMGKNYVGLCPFHEDSTPSLTVSPSRQKWNCYSCDAPGGDALDFIVHLKGCSVPEGVEELTGGKSIDEFKTLEATPIAPRVESKPDWVQIKPESDPTSFNHYIHGEPSKKWAYHSADGGVFGYVCRFEHEDGKKTVLPFVFAQGPNFSEWRYSGFAKPRPLYNLHLIEKYPNAQIVIVEGEKTADAVQEQLNPEIAVCTTWIGGANGIHVVDWEPLKGRDAVIYWPDHDTDQKYGEKHEKAGDVKPWFEQPGNMAMLEIHKQLVDLIERHVWVDVPAEFPHKWDAADKEWTKNELKLFIKNNSGDVPVVPEDEPESEATEVEKPAVVIAPKNPTLPPRKERKKSVTENKHFRFLGYDKDENSRPVYFFFGFDVKMVVKLTPASMTKANLMTLAPINFWEKSFPGSKSAKINIDAAQQFLIGNSHNVGPFRSKYIRGRGAWIDEERLIIHTGENLLIDNVSTPLRDFHSGYVYEVGENMHFGNDQMLSTADAAFIVPQLASLSWERSINAYLLAGWCVIAPFCGVLDWRPHIQITGAAGTGKSWAMEQVIKRLLGDVSIAVQGKTTEAGIRGMLQSDAIPVLFDEADVDSMHDKERVQGVISLARSASYSDGGVVGKGTAVGGGRQTQMRSCFAFSSIQVQMNQQSDRSRISILSLRPFEGSRTKEEWAQFELGWNKKIDSEYVKSLHTRTMHLLPVILENIRTFSDAASHVIGSRRIGDQIGGMLAGAFSLSSTKVISYEDAVEWVTKRDWDDEKGLDATSDQNQLFNNIISHKLKVESTYGNVDRNIGEIIAIASNKVSGAGISADIANDTLKRIGIMVVNDRFYIANNQPSIVSILSKTSWGSNYNKIIERLPDANKETARSFSAGIKSRSISLPIEMVIPKEN